MRLIDADELMNTLGAIRNKIGAEFDYKRIMQEIRKRARHNNIKVIPIEWIEKQMTEREDYGDFNTAAAIGYLLLSWEKENANR